MIFCGARFDHPGLMQAQGGEAQGILPDVHRGAVDGHLPRKDGLHRLQRDTSVRQRLLGLLLDDVLGFLVALDDRRIVRRREGIQLR
jgi:hypothetical protein